ncbi:MAG TPA: hypothetical protein VIC34_12495 [Croceibacterium sp.]|jgi:hypothetical protein
MSPGDIFDIVIVGVIGAVSIVGVSVIGWIYNTRQKIKHGYPLESMWGKPLHPQITNEANERVKLITQENAQLRAELGSLHDRMVSVERIVTDSGYQLGHEIESLREKGKVQ